MIGPLLIIQRDATEIQNASRLRIVVAIVSDEIVQIVWVCGEYGHFIADAVPVLDHGVIPVICEDGMAVDLQKEFLVADQALLLVTSDNGTARVSCVPDVLGAVGSSGGVIIHGM
mgnify:CR=1 FL=1